MPEHPTRPGEEFLRRYDFELPPERIARYPAPERSAARLMVLNRGRPDEPPRHLRVRDLPGLLAPGDLLVVNDSRVMPARCHARRATGGRVEVLFLEPGPGPVEVLLRPSRRLKPGERLEVEGGGELEVLERRGEGWLVRSEPEPWELMQAVGEVPLPPYIDRAPESLDRERYQTVFAREPGSTAAPTASLHLDEPLLAALRERGVGLARITLHVGPGTFRPLRLAELERGELHPERYEVPAETARAVRELRERGGRLVAVGTTAVRALESATPRGERVPRPGPGVTRLFVREGYRFRAVDALLTNFHIPRSSLVVLVAAFLGRERLLAAYREAVERGYRFYSYGDAMLVL